MVNKADEKKVRILLAVSVAIVAIVFALVFFQFPDNSLAHFQFRIEDDGYATVMGYTGNAARLEIPSEYEGHEVRYISENAFGGTYSRLKSITIPDTVRKIGDYAFAYSPELKTVELSSQLVSIGRGAFEGCEKLKTIAFPETLQMIDDQAFYGCIRLSRLYIPASVNTIGYDAFAACESLILDVSDSPLAAEVAESYFIETGRVDQTALYLVIALAVSALIMAAIAFVMREVRKKHKRDTASAGDERPLHKDKNE